jgi:hypothetical protein
MKINYFNQTLSSGYLKNLPDGVNLITNLYLALRLSVCEASLSHLHLPLLVGTENTMKVFATLHHEGLQSLWMERFTHS